MESSVTRRIHQNDPCPCLSGGTFKECCGIGAPADAEGFTTQFWTRRTNPNAPEVGTREGYTIVKVQVSSDEGSPALIYDRTRAFERLVDTVTVQEAMKGRPKAFFYSTRENGQIVLGEEAPYQAW
jgi:hypothetical protein